MCKEFKFINAAAKKEFINLPDDIKKQFGVDLNAVQHGADPFSTFKHIADSVGVDAIELIENGSPAYRSVYCAKYLDTVYVLHSFEKTTNGVDRAAMATAKSRHKIMMEEVREEEKEAKKQAKNKTKMKIKTKKSKSYKK